MRLRHWEPRSLKKKAQRNQRDEALPWVELSTHGIGQARGVVPSAKAGHEKEIFRVDGPTATIAVCERRSDGNAIALVALVDCRKWRVLGVEHHTVFRG